MRYKATFIFLADPALSASALLEAMRGQPEFTGAVSIVQLSGVRTALLEAEIEALSDICAMSDAVRGYERALGAVGVPFSPRLRPSMRVSS